MVVPSGQVGCASGVGLKAEGQPCPAAAKLRLIGYRNCAALRSQAATAPARVSSAAMNKIAGISEPESELERLIAELSESGQPTCAAARDQPRSIKRAGERAD